MTNKPSQMQQPYPQQYPYEEDTISLMDILLVLARHLKLIIIVPSIFCIGTIIYAVFFTSPIYESTSTFMSSGSGGGKQSQSQMLGGIVSQLGFSMPSGDVSELQWSYEDILNSRTIARSILEHKFDTEKFGPQKSLLQILTYGDEEPAVGVDILIKGAINTVQGMIEVSTSGNLYKLKITSFDPQLAADIANAVMEELDRHQRDYNAMNTSKTRQFIEERLMETKAELEAAEEALKEFRERNRSIFESPQLQLEQERLGRDVAVLIGVFTTLKQQLETAKINEVNESDYFIVLDEPEIPIYKSGPNRKLMVIIAGFLGIGLGIVLVFIREYARNSDDEEQEKISKVKSLVVKNITDFLPQRLRKI